MVSQRPREVYSSREQVSCRDGMVDAAGASIGGSPMWITGPSIKVSRRATTIRDCVLHMRIGFQACLFTLFTTGFAVTGSGEFARALWGGAVFFLLVSAGVVSFNSYYDKDDSPVNFLKHPPAATRALLLFSVALLCAGVLAAWSIGPRFGLISMLCALLGVLYSHPLSRLKVKFGMDLVINALGYGGLTVLAGAACASENFSRQTLYFAAIMSLVVAAGHPLTQLFQYDSDRSRGDTTFTVLVGVDSAFRISLVLSAISSIAMARFIAHYFSVPSVVLFLAVAVPANVLLVCWYLLRRRLDPRKMMYWVYGIAAVGCLLFDWVAYHAL